MEVPGSDRDGVLVFVVFLVEAVEEGVMEGHVDQVVHQVLHDEHDRHLDQHHSRTGLQCHVSYDGGGLHLCPEVGQQR